MLTNNIFSSGIILIVVSQLKMLDFEPDGV